MESVLAPAAIQAGEAALVERAQQGDHDAFASLVDVRLTTTFRTALAILGNEADARDATQEIFLRTWRNLPELREPDRFGAWFGRIVVNTCRTAIRDRRRRIVREISVGMPRVAMLVAILSVAACASAGATAPRSRPDRR